MRRSAPGRAGAAFVLALALLVLTAGAAQGKVVVVGGKAYGVTPTPKAAGSALGRGRSVARSQTVPFTVGGPQPPLEYHEGPLMLSSHLYLIFWGPENSFAQSYTEPIIQYAKDLHADEALTKDEFTVAEQYTNAAKAHITSSIGFEPEKDVAFDTSEYPALEPSRGCTEAPCVTDTQIQAEIIKEIEANGWPTEAAAKPEAQYLLYTPKGVASCIAPGECTFSQELGFCAYHSQITEGLTPSGNVATYSDLPYVSQCDSGQAPSGVGGNEDADGTLDSEIHEIVESSTDPTGTGYLDKNGEEIADKCAYFPGVIEPPEAYGAPLGGSLTEFTAFNQLIDGHTYYTQQMWSNASTQTPVSGEPAGCIARIGPTPSFTTPSTAATGQAVAFDGNGSYDIGHPLTTYEWNYGDGSPVDATSGASAEHIYTVPGTYAVTLTVSDSGGPADASTQTLPLVVTGAAIAAPTASIASPADKQTFTLGQGVTTSFSCAEAPGGPGIASCKDSNGAASPGTLDTSTLGAHSYTVSALSFDGLSATARIEYTVVNPTGGPAGSSPSSTALGSPATPPTTTNTTASTSKAGSASKLERALKACRRQPRKKRARCIAAAKKRFGPHRHATRKRK